MATPAAKYVQEEGNDGERPLKVCAEAGRKCVKNIQQYPILSQEWIALVDSLKQLTRLVQLEGRMPANAKVSEMHGRNTDSDGTLWDQEAHETAIRILVEEAKVNLCLRIMNDYKVWQYRGEEKKAAVAEVARNFGYPEAHLEQKMNQFEEALGMLLAKAFNHVETLQLMDIHLLLEHVALILNHCRTGDAAATAAAAGTKMQETVVLVYFSSLMKHAEALNNSELLAKSKELRLPQLVCDHTLRYFEELSLDHITAVAEGFSALAYNEDFSCDWEPWFLGADGAPDPSIRERFLEMEDKVAGAVIKANADRKRDLRPLLDFFNTLKRST